jgi:hypothetical protein
MTLRSPLSALLGATSTAWAFPPYRTTDAGTADPWVIEGRLGLARVAREGDENTFTAPLLRMNLGLPHDIELVSELEYAPDDERLGDAAIGAKWIPWGSTLSLGIEALVLLPVSAEGGSGLELSLLGSYRAGPWRLHLNAGGFVDARPAETESGW